MQEGAKQVIAGSISASISTLICHPIDVLRTELQVQAIPTTARECIRRIVKEEGPRGFYKGLSAPLAAQAVYKAIIFGTNSTFQGLVLSYRPRPRPELTYLELFLCGTMAGAVNSTVVTPVELVRNRLVALKGRFRGPADCVSYILRHDGFLGLWRGLIPTLWRDGPGVGAWFLAFAAGKDAIRRQKQHSQYHHRRLSLPSSSSTDAGRGAAAAAAVAGRKGVARNSEASLAPLGLLELLLAGSGAGVAFWTVALPFDTIKSVVQVQGVDPLSTTAARSTTTITSSSSKSSSSSRHSTGDLMVKAVVRLIKEGGIWRLFRGWQGAFGRAIPGSATTLATFDLVKDRL